MQVAALRGMAPGWCWARRADVPAACLRDAACLPTLQAERTEATRSARRIKCWGGGRLINFSNCRRARRSALDAAACLGGKMFVQLRLSEQGLSCTLLSSDKASAHPSSLITSLRAFLGKLRTQYSQAEHVRHLLRSGLVTRPCPGAARALMQRVPGRLTRSMCQPERCAWLPRQC